MKKLAAGTKAFARFMLPIIVTSMFWVAVGSAWIYMQSAQQASYNKGVADGVAQTRSMLLPEAK